METTSIETEVTSFRDSTTLLDDAAALRARAEDDGFLYFRNFIPREEVLEVRAQLLGVVERHGWRQPGQNDLGGRIDLEAISRVKDGDMRVDIGVSREAYKDAQKVESVHRLPHHPKLMEFYRQLFSEEVLLHPRHIIRMITSHPVMVPTPPHQDFPLIQGTANTWTCWIPIGDCPRSCGGLTILKGSHKKGYLPIQLAKGAGNMAVQLCPWETHWMSGDYEAGDIITFPSHTVHKALRCHDKELIRLSLDVRYQPLSEPVEEKSLLPHCDLNWEEIYLDWNDADFKYYWKKQKLTKSVWNDQYRQPGRRIC